MRVGDGTRTFGVNHHPPLLGTGRTRTVTAAPCPNEVKTIILELPFSRLRKNRSSVRQLWFALSQDNRTIRVTRDQDGISGSLFFNFDRPTRVAAKHLRRTIVHGKDAVPRKDGIASNETKRRLRELVEILNKVERTFARRWRPTVERRWTCNPSKRKLDVRCFYPFR